MKKASKKSEFTARELRHAADVSERRAGRMLSDAADCGTDHPEERDALMRKARKAHREAAGFRALADVADLD